MKKPKLKAVKREDGWWITGWPSEGFEDCGPYDTRAETVDAKAGLERTLEHWDERSFWTKASKKPPK